MPSSAWKKKRALIYDGLGVLDAPLLPVLHRGLPAPPLFPYTTLFRSELAGLFGSFQTIRLVHFLCMSAIVAFIVVHVSLAVLVPQSLVAMKIGRAHV